MIGKVFATIFGSADSRTIKKFRPFVEAINALEPEMQAMSDAELAAQTDKFKKQLAEGATVDDILVPAFATVREASRRTLNMRHYDVQLMGGIALHQGKIAEMNTGEGKTLVATLAAYLNALEGKGAHVITVNDYLAKRDAEWMGTVYKSLGMSVGSILHGMDDQSRRAAYACDITYGTNSEFGFDYLRDNMKFRVEDRVQRGHHYVIVDEVDSVLIDEARTPLIISGPSSETTDMYHRLDRLVPFLKKGEILYENDPDLKEYTGDFIVDEKTRNVTLTDEGMTKVEQMLELTDRGEIEALGVMHYATLALKAHVLYEKDTDYVVDNGEIVIVDEFTGRKQPGRRWSEGLHQAIEAKEGLAVRPENQTLATITYQNLFRMYDKLSGMTGTAATEAAEFYDIYKLEVAKIPTNLKLLRKEFNDVVFVNEQAKFRAVAREAKELQETGQPVLIGTVSIEKSEELSKILTEMGVKHEVLNAKNHAREAEIIAQAGRLGAVTVSTNMAGRGTDIVLGGNAEFLARTHFAEQQNFTPTQEQWDGVFGAMKAQTNEEKQEVKELGGLHVIGTERHESRRIDNQLRGRAGRQGDPGSSRFYVSLDDDLVRIFGGDKLKGIMQSLGMEEDDPIESKMVSKRIAGAQKSVEGQHYSTRKHLLEYDDVMNIQRKIVYGMRDSLLDGEEQKGRVAEMMKGLVGAIIEKNLPMKGYSETWNWEGLEDDMEEEFGIKIDTEALKGIKPKKIEETLVAQLAMVYGEKEKSIGADTLRSIESAVMLSIIDREWKDHLFIMDSLKEGIGLRSYAQQDPLIEYKREAFNTFKYMMSRIENDTISHLFKFKYVEPEVLLQQKPSASGPFAEVAKPETKPESSPVVKAKSAEKPDVKPVEEIAEEAPEVKAQPQAAAANPKQKRKSPGASGP